MPDGNIGQLGIEMVLTGTGEVVAGVKSAYSEMTSASKGYLSSAERDDRARLDSAKELMRSIRDENKRHTDWLENNKKSSNAVIENAERNHYNNLENISQKYYDKLEDLEIKSARLQQDNLKKEESDLKSSNERKLNEENAFKAKIAATKARQQKEGADFLQYAYEQRAKLDAEALSRKEKEEDAEFKATNQKNQQILANARLAAEQRKQLATSVATHINSATRSVISDIGVLTRLAGFALTVGGGLAVHNVVSNLMGQQRAAADVSIASNGTINAHQAMDLSRDLSHKYNIEEQPLLEASASYERLRKGGGASAMSIMPEMAKLSYAEGIDLNQLANAMGKAVSQMPEMTRAEEIMLLRVIAGEVKRGNDPSSALARLTGQATLFGGDKFRNMMELETLGGIANERSAGPGQADNAVGMLANNLLTHAKAMTKTQGHTEMGPDGKLLSPFVALMDVIANAKGNVATIEKELGLGQRGSGPMAIALVDIYNKAEKEKKGSGTQAGMDYLVDKFVKQAITDEQIDEDLKTRLTSSERIDIAFRKLRDNLEDKFEPVLERMIPVFENLIPKIENIFDKLLGGSESLTNKFEWAADKIQWVMDHIVSSVELAMGLIVAKAALGQVITGIGGGLSQGIGNMLVGAGGASAVEGSLLGVGEAAGGATVGLEGVGVVIGESLLGPLGALAVAVTIAGAAFVYMNEEADKAKRAKEQEGKKSMQERMDVDDRRKHALTQAEAESKAANQSFESAKENVKKKHGGAYIPTVTEQVQIKKLEDDAIEKQNKIEHKDENGNLVGLKPDYVNYHKDLGDALKRDRAKILEGRVRARAKMDRASGLYIGWSEGEKEDQANTIAQRDMTPDEREAQSELDFYYRNTPGGRGYEEGNQKGNWNGMTTEDMVGHGKAISEGFKGDTANIGKVWANGMYEEIVKQGGLPTKQDVKNSVSGNTNPTSQ